MQELLRQSAAIMGAGGVLTGDDTRSRSATWGGGPCQAAAILRPPNTGELSRVLRLCYRVRQPVVPQGGRTGRADGCVAGPSELAISLERMHRIERVDQVGKTPCQNASIRMNGWYVILNDLFIGPPWMASTIGV